MELRSKTNDKSLNKATSHNIGNRNHSNRSGKPKYQINPHHANQQQNYQLSQLGSGDISPGPLLKYKTRINVTPSPAKNHHHYQQQKIINQNLLSYIQWIVNGYFMIY